MSMRLMSRVWDMKLTKSQKLLLLRLCDYANDDGLCYPRQAKLQEQCSMGKTTVNEYLSWFEEVGILTRERRQKGGQRKSDLYHINLDNFNSEGSNSERSKSESSKSESSKSERSDSEGAKVQISNLPLKKNHQ